ncbi:MAG: DUF2842 domain-containing protein [Candidatus Puniceispirillum sp.]|jgi:hypothetical protein
MLPHLTLFESAISLTDAFFSSMVRLLIMIKRWRHFSVAIGLVPALFLYVGAVLQIADLVINIHVLVDMVFYVIAGLAWIPLAGRVVGWLAKHESR